MWAKKTKHYCMNDELLEVKALQQNFPAHHCIVKELKNERMHLQQCNIIHVFHVPRYPHSVIDTNRTTYALRWRQLHRHEAQKLLCAFKRRTRHYLLHVPTSMLLADSTATGITFLMFYYKTTWQNNTLYVKIHTHNMRWWCLWVYKVHS